MSQESLRTKQAHGGQGIFIAESRSDCRDSLIGYSSGSLRRSHLSPEYACVSLQFVDMLS